MTDIPCAHCGEPWDIDGLRHDSAGYVEPDEADILAPLESTADMITYLENNGGELDKQIRTGLDNAEGLSAGQHTRIPDLFRW